jgi:hypothetical protein
MPGACTFKNITAVINSYIVCHCQPLPPYSNICKQNGTYGTHSKIRLQEFPENYKLGGKWLTMTNTLAYYYTESITTVIIW